MFLDTLALNKGSPLFPTQVMQLLGGVVCITGVTDHKKSFTMKLPLQLLLHLLGVSVLRTHESYQPLLHFGSSTETENTA